MHRFKDLEIWKLSRLCENELETQLLISNDLDSLEDKELEFLTFNLNSIVKMTSKFKSTLQ